MAQQRQTTFFVNGAIAIDTEGAIMRGIVGGTVGMSTIIEARPIRFESANVMQQSTKEKKCNQW